MGPPRKRRQVTACCHRKVGFGARAVVCGKTAERERPFRQRGLPFFRSMIKATTDRGGRKNKGRIRGNGWHATGALRVVVRRKVTKNREPNSSAGKKREKGTEKEEERTT